MPKLSKDQLAALAVAAGVPPKNVPVAVAVALAESGGNSSATNVNTNGSVDRGLWQINSIHLRGKLRGWSADDLYDPAKNAQAMAVVSSGGTNWKPWVAYTSGAYKRHLNGDDPTLMDRLTGGLWPGGSGVGTPTLGANPLDALRQLANFLANPQHWLRLLMAIGGLVALTLGLLMLSRDLVEPVVGRVARAVVP